LDDVSERSTWIFEKRPCTGRRLLLVGVENQNKYKDDKMSGRDAVMINSEQHRAFSCRKSSQSYESFQRFLAFDFMTRE
jgi:hypothetical protein